MGIKLKLFGVVVLIAMAAGIGGYGALHSAPSEAPPQATAMPVFQRQTDPAPPPTASFLDEAGNSIDFSRFKGKITLINLWATWCLPCVKEMPSLERLQTARESDRFTIATISEDRQGAPAVQNFFERNALTGLPRYLDPQGELSRAFKINGLPTTLLLDREGREIGRFEGIAEWDSPQILRLIDSYISGAG